MKKLSFELTMPNIGSHNGKWSGSEKKYFLIKTVDTKTAEKVMTGAKTQPIYEGYFKPFPVGYSEPRKDYYYDFGDGWGANIRVEIVDAKEARKRIKYSAGFCGYDWMVGSIILYDKIDYVKNL